MEQAEMFDPRVHQQPPPVIPIREGVAPQPQPAPRPAPTPQQRLFTEPVKDVSPQYLAIAKAVSHILATRVLLLICVLTASAIWIYCAYDPTQLRIAAGGVYSALVVWPLTWLYFRKG